ncbi:MAG TPA: hypothetical protein VGF75_06470, partial [Candidatus Saccharimonadales bacterium]
HLTWKISYSGALRAIQTQQDFINRGKQAKIGRTIPKTQNEEIWLFIEGGKAKVRFRLGEPLPNKDWVKVDRWEGINVKNIRECQEKMNLYSKNQTKTKVKFVKIEIIIGFHKI